MAFRSLTEGMDTTTASGELLFHVFGALARLWDTASGKPVAELKGHEKGINGVAFQPAAVASASDGARRCALASDHFLDPPWYVHEA